MEMKKVVPGLLALILVVGGFYVGLTTAGSDGEGSAADGDAARSGADGELAIEAPGVRFATPEGDSASLADHRGQVVVLNLWGTWCPPCRREIPHLVDLQDRLDGMDATVVGLAVDSGTPQEIMDFARDFDVDYPIWMGDSRTVVQHYEAMGFPTTLIVDREGIIRKRYLGPQTAERLLEDLRAYL